MAEPRSEQLRLLYQELDSCDRCPLSETRENVVAGMGDPDADVMFVGEAPGYHEDQQGLPFVGRAGKLLDELLSDIGLSREQVYIANVLKCRPPDNRDPQTHEIEMCREYLERQIDIVDPSVVCTMGNFSTRLLLRSSEGISRLHGRQQPFPGRDKTCIFPVFHPAAALYTKSNLTLLKEDFARLATLLPSAKPEPILDTPEENTEPGIEVNNGKPEPEQLGLF